MRNLIIIATSNAAADLLWKWEKEKTDIFKRKHELIDHIIKHGLFRPEFLNRFDDIIAFHTLEKAQVRKIAKLHLEALAKRIKNERNITIVVDDVLVNEVVSVGYDPKFGARPMNRAIKDMIEQAIADRILAGTLSPGDTFHWTPTRDAATSHTPRTAGALA